MGNTANDEQNNPRPTRPSPNSNRVSCTTNPKANRANPMTSMTTTNVATEAG